MRADDGRAGLEQRDLVIVERLAVQAFQSVDFSEHIVAQAIPVEFAIGHVPAEFARILQVFGEVRAINEQFFWARIHG